MQHPQKRLTELVSKRKETGGGHTGGVTVEKSQEVEGVKLLVEGGVLVSVGCQGGLSTEMTSEQTPVGGWGVGSTAGRQCSLENCKRAAGGR